MGWTSQHATHYNRYGVNRKAECDDLINWSDEHHDFTVVKSRMVGSEYYAAVKNECGIVFGVVILTWVDNKDRFNFGYKIISEVDGPAYYNCPNSILDLLSETDDADAAHWRAKCRKYNESKKAISKLYKMPVGTKVEFESPNYYACDISKGDRITAEKQERNGKPCWVFWIRNIRYECKPSFIGDSYVVI